MQTFDKDESAYTATAQNIVFSASDQYDVTKLDNPVRARVNHILNAAHEFQYRRLPCL